MDNLSQENKLNLNNKSFNDYHCIKCGKLPLLHFSHYDFDLICSTHKILNIPIDDISKYITTDYECSTCKQPSNKSKIIYCFQCDKYYCDKCLNTHNTDTNKLHNIINVIEKNIKCKLHNKIYDKFCFKCKLNLCELCEMHKDHYVELFKDVYPSDEDIYHFNQIKKIILIDLEKKEKENEKSIELLKEEKENKGKEKEEEKENENSEEDEYNEENVEEIIKMKEELIIKIKKLKEYIEIKTLFIKSFSRNITNYNYINNINNIIRCLNLIERPYFKNDTIKHINILEKNDKNNIENKILIKSLHFEKRYSTTWCMKKLNTIEINNKNKLELIAIGNSENNVILINLLNFQIYQVIQEHEKTVYSLEQYKDDPNFLFSSSSDSFINVYILDKTYKYKLVQKLQKLPEFTGYEINKVIALSNRLLVSSDRRSITIWKSNNTEENTINYEDYFEIVIDEDTCHLLEVNPSIFVATQYQEGGTFQVYKNNGKSFPLLGELKNTITHGNSSNGLAKINDNLVCSGGKTLFYIISIEPLQIVQKIILEEYLTVEFMHITKDHYLYCSTFGGISQYKLINDENNNFIELIKIGDYSLKDYYQNYYITKKISLPLDDGRIVLISEIKGILNYQLIA